MNKTNVVLACFELREIQSLTETEMKPSFLLKIAGVLFNSKFCLDYFYGGGGREEMGEGYSRTKLFEVYLKKINLRDYLIYFLKTVMGALVSHTSKLLQCGTGFGISHKCKVKITFQIAG